MEDYTEGCFTRQFYVRAVLYFPIGSLVFIAPFFNSVQIQGATVWMSVRSMGKGGVSLTGW